MHDGYDQTLSGLLRKRAELATEATAQREAYEAKLAALDAIDAAIRVFRPDLVTEYLPTNRPPVPHAAATSEMRRFLLDMLRERHGRPLRTLEATDALVEAKGVDPRDRVVVVLMRKRVSDAFQRLRKKGLVEGRKYGSGSELEWRLVRCV